MGCTSEKASEIIQIPTIQILREKMGRTLALRIVFRFMPELSGVAITKLQGLNKKWYEQFVPMMLDSVTLYKAMACCLLTG